jgi:hypothetical protein
MIELAVNVINALAVSLPGAAENEWLVDRTPLLIAALPRRYVPGGFVAKVVSDANREY